MPEFNPSEWGYKPEEVRSHYGEWIVVSVNLPVIAYGADNAWYCPIEIIDSQRLIA